MTSETGEGDFDPETVAALVRDMDLGRTDVRVAGQCVEVQRDDALVVILCVRSLQNAALNPYTEKFSVGHVGVVLVGPPPEDVLARLPSRAVLATLHEIDAPHALSMALDGTLERVELRLAAERRSRSIRRYRYELSELVEIARAMTQERNIDRLLDLILEKSRFITGADAGSIYTVETTESGEQRLRFKLSQNESQPFESSEFTIPVSTRSIAGAAVVTRRPINIPDVYRIGDDEPFGFDRSFDERVGYRTKSMITMPMISAEDEVIGVIQLINKKRDPEERLSSPEGVEAQVIPFDPRATDLLATLSSQAGIALENALLYDEIRSIFEGFVRASVQAIEQRDPTTSGHSLRVSVLSCRLAQVVDRADSGRFAKARFSRRDLQELEYAALLHDFGKIGVREQVLVKAKKLYPHQLAQVRARFDYALKALEADVLGRKVRAMNEGAGAADLATLDEELARRSAEIEGAWKVISEANEPTVLNEGDFGRIAELGQRAFVGPGGVELSFLQPEEVESLQVTRGSLNADEIEEIRSHVVHTYNFLSKIPWGKNFLHVPEIAGAHHEKLNGSGYPKGLHEDAIPLPSKIMTIADIYDALTARDRPYKKAVPVERALAILGFEVKDGNIDADLVQAFVDAEVYREVEKDLEY
ncbi:MAG TPA: HD domain-containing phosphohydrolase [Sandaracinaceae bacterium LLY-WYZ-13_1]|nr:HD domain-containing phosphohydrolase [Sandaracinaceae bacterium LLY-WYZ-13_1]